jgi:hypothetical protein
MNYNTNGMAPLFAEVAAVLRQHRTELNEADTFNGNHGDHMVVLFEAASQAVPLPNANESNYDLAQALESATQALYALSENGSAQVYGRGLEQFASQFRQSQITLDDLVGYARNLVEDQTEVKSSLGGLSPARSGLLLKALVAGLDRWQQAEASAWQANPGIAGQTTPPPLQSNPQGSGLSMGALFDLGIIYFQAKQRGGSRLEVIADAAATASPLAAIPHRYLSGKLALHSLLQALAKREINLLGNPLLNNDRPPSAA